MAVYWGPKHDHIGIATTTEDGFNANQLLRWAVLRLFEQTKDGPPPFVASNTRFDGCRHSAVPAHRQTVRSLKL